MCKPNFACSEVTFSEYLTTEIIVMGVASCLHIPLWFFILLVVDIKKNGGRVRDAFKIFKVRIFISNEIIINKYFSQKKEEPFEEDANEVSDIGENEDQDVKAERQKVKNLMHSHNAHQSVVMVEVSISKIIFASVVMLFSSRICIKNTLKTKINIVNVVVRLKKMPRPLKLQ